MHGVDQVVQVAAETIELPDDERVPVAEGLEACCESWPVVFISRRVILVQLLRVNAGLEECIALRVSSL